MPVADATTALFVPGDRPERFEKAAATGADVVIIDLEDAVATERKGAARASAIDALTSASPLYAAIRINALDADGADDLAALAAVAAGGSARLRAILLPKAEAPEDVAAVAAAAPGIPVVPLIESATGLAAAVALARVPGVSRLAFGALDFGVDVDATSPSMLDYARCALVLASRAAGLAKPLDSPNPEFRDAAIVQRGAAAARSLGFGGQLCIHPLQVPIVAEAFLPTPEETAWAERIAAVRDGGASQVDGAMVDRPVLLRAQAILARGKR